jgi:sugar lactone lactonase YvrE
MQTRIKFGFAVFSALVFAVLGAVCMGTVMLSSAEAAPPTAPSSPSLLFSGLGGGAGSTVGPDGALYVTDTVAGRILRVDPTSGASTVYADCLPAQIPAVGLGGPMDVAFIGSTAYALVTIVDAQFGGSDVDGVYRIDGAHTCTIVADIGAWALAHPPTGFDFFVQTGVQYAMQPYRGGFLVTDGHHNRVLQVGLDGSVSAFRSFGDIVPTGLAAHGNTVYMAEAGPVPHLPENGRIVSFDAKSSAVTDVASGGRLLVDVEFGRGRTLFALAQGVFTPGNPPGSPAEPNTGKLLRVNGSGGFASVAEGLNRPTSLEVIGNTAYVVTLGGEIWKIENIASPPYGTSH